MRVFLPSTLPALAQALQAGQVGPGPVPGFAVTPSLREAYASGDEEELEYTALTEAARASLRLLARDKGPGRVVISAAVPVERLASAHVDEAEASADVRAAVDALPAADAGDEDANFAVDG